MWTSGHTRSWIYTRGGDRVSRRVASGPMPAPVGYGYGDGDGDGMRPTGLRPVNKGRRTLSAPTSRRDTGGCSDSTGGLMLQRVPSTWDTGKAARRPLRLLIEDADPALAISDFGCYRDAGMDVALCSGPSGPGGPGTEPGDCPILTGGPCRLLSSADVVLHHLPTETGVVDAIRRQADRPGLITVGGPDADLTDVAPVGSRIRAVRRHRRTPTGQGGIRYGPPDQA